jgi:hypothetical protein
MADGTGKDRIRMTIGEARTLGKAAMRGAGFDDDDARILTDHVRDAASQTCFCRLMRIGAKSAGGSKWSKPRRDRWG